MQKDTDVAILMKLTKRLYGNRRLTDKNETNFGTDSITNNLSFVFKRCKPVFEF